MKQCFKCYRNKPLDDFYRHKQMGDGHLNKCKDCTKNDVHERYNDLKEDIQFVTKERKRGREKYHRLYPHSLQVANGMVDQSYRVDYRNKWKEKYPEKIRAREILGNIKNRKPGCNYHHWSYNEEHAKDTIELLKKDHYKAHRFIVYDQDFKMYRRSDNNNLLDTKDKHSQYINFCIENFED